MLDDTPSRQLTDIQNTNAHNLFEGQLMIQPLSTPRRVVSGKIEPNLPGSA